MLKREVMRAAGYSGPQIDPMTTPQNVRVHNLRYLATFFALKTGEVNDGLELVLSQTTDW